MRGTRTPASSPAATDKKKRIGWRIAPELMAILRRRRRAIIPPVPVVEANLGEAQRLFGAFTPAKPPPGVVPTGAPSLAMDQTIEVLGWASQSGYNSAFAEGTTFLGYAYLSELAQRPEYRALTEVIASEMTREWIEIKSASEDDDKSDKIKELDARLRELNAPEIFYKAATHDGFFGRGHVYLDTGDTDDPTELKVPIGDGTGLLSQLKVNQQHPIVALRNVEPVWTYPTQYDSNDPLKADWYKPSNWFVMGKELHVSRLLVFIGREVPDLLKPAYSFGGLSMSQMAKPYVDNWLRTRQSVADLIHAFSVMVLKTDLQATLQTGYVEFLERLNLFNTTRDNHGVMAIDKEAEDFQNVSAPLGGLEGLQAQTQEHMAAISRIPIVKLLGIQPSGLNASSEGEIRTFYDWIHAYQEHLFRKNLDRVFRFVQLSLWNEVDEDLVYEFKSLWQLDEAGEMAVQKTIADYIATFVELGAISPATAAKVAANDPKSPFAGIDLESEIPPEVPEESEENLLENEEETGTPPEGEVPPHQGGSRLPSAVTTRAAELGGAGSGDLALGT